ncbi:MAG: ABC transporter ATP-binding protein [Anaerolineae bacterium]|jgi:ABC-2 type transport system ATP-binding protein|nr:ABC transporter ATP-binding protein [Anaerolineae bacterium]
MDEKNQAVIQTTGLSKSFGSVHALSDVNLIVPQNSIFGFLGPNGAGKTTTMKLLLGLMKPTSGSATIFGQDVVRESIAIRERIGFLPQHPHFIEYMSAKENLLFAARFFFTGPKNKLEDRCHEMLSLVGLSDKSNRPIKGFSGGEKQRLGIALAQINYPDLLILDEPAAALDPIGRREVLEIMDRLRKHTTIFYSTHILDDVQSVSDRVAILKQGKLVAQGPIEIMLNSKDSSIVYSLSLKGNPGTLTDQLAVHPWVTTVERSPQPQNGVTHWQICVNDETAAERQLLRTILADDKVIVTEFSRKKYELEEVFLDIVKGPSYDSK